MRPAPPRPIRPDDPVAEFDCGVPVLNAWLVQRAWRNESSGDSRTYVCLDADTGVLLGFYCLSSATVARDDASGWLARNAPDPIPVILLGRLAVALDARGYGIGRDLVAHALSRANEAARILGARALLAEAKDPPAAAFYRRLGFESVADAPLSLVARLRPDTPSAGMGHPMRSARR